jgi:hypothetical protein
VGIPEPAGMVGMVVSFGNTRMWEYWKHSGNTPANFRNMGVWDN